MPIAPKCVRPSVAPRGWNVWKSFGEKASGAPVPNNLFCVVIRYVCNQELISLCQPVRCVGGQAEITFPITAGNFNQRFLLVSWSLQLLLQSKKNNICTKSRDLSDCIHIMLRGQRHVLRFCSEQICSSKSSWFAYPILIDGDRQDYDMILGKTKTVSLVRWGCAINQTLIPIFTHKTK